MEGAKVYRRHVPASRSQQEPGIKGCNQLSSVRSRPSHVVQWYEHGLSSSCLFFLSVSSSSSSCFFFFFSLDWLCFVSFQLCFVSFQLCCCQFSTLLLSVFNFVLSVFNFVLSVFNFVLSVFNSMENFRWVNSDGLFSPMRWWRWGVGEDGGL